MADTPTVETFEQIARHRTLRDMVDFLVQLDKKDVLAVRQKTKELQREMFDWRREGTRFPHERSGHLFLAGVATYSRKEALGRSFDIPWHFLNNDPKYTQGHQELFMILLRHTRPAWLTEWLQRITRSNPWQVLSYSQLRGLADEGLVEYDPWLFAQSLAHLLVRYNWQRNQVKSGNIHGYDKQILAFLQADPVLLERDLPLLFDFDTMVDSASTFTDKDRREVTWLTLLPQLVESGYLDRADLLTRSLLALRRDFRRPLLMWFKNLFGTLQPTAAERLARQGELVELLAHPLPLVVNFALDQLKDLWTDPAFEPAPLLLYAEGLLTRQDLKTALRTLLGAFEKLVKREPGLAPTVARLAASALTNADAGVQERAAKLLASLLSAKKPLLSFDEAEEVTATISLYADLLTAAARTTLASFLVAAAPESAATQAAAYAPLAEFVPDISSATAIAPVADWHELLFLTGQVVAQNEPAAVERWLEGLLRLRGQYPAGYAQQLRPYLLQALPWELKGKTEEETATILRGISFAQDRNGHPQLILALLISWFQGFTTLKTPGVNLQDQKYSNPDPLLRVEQQRLAAAEQQLLAGAETLPLLSTPSHAPHWVAPSVLVQKLLAYEAAGRTPDAADLALALARTAFRAEADAAVARELLPRLHHPELRPLLHWFLAPADVDAPIPIPLPAGQELVSVVQAVAKKLGQLNPFRPTAPAPASAPLAQALPWLWAVAGRTRRPLAHFPELLPLATGPGLADPWSPQWQFEQKSNTYKQSWNKEKPEVTTVWQELNVGPTFPGKRPPSPLLLYSLHASLPHTNNYYLWLVRPDLPFLLTLLPNNPAPLHWHLLATACRTENQGSEGRDVVQQFLNSLLVPGPQFDESTTVLLAMGLVHNAPVCRALALEVLLAAIATGRLVPAALGEALGKILTVEFAPLQRLTDVLAQARAIDPVTDDALRQLLDALLPTLPATPLRNTRKLIEAYADLQSRTRHPVPAAVQGRLREWSSSATLKKAAAGLVPA
ncbi:DUF6493 family protein [Hymenobacter metallicola]|uniref:HEAT repeat domain-containing protein n=1 Tax=Hymenobacter metallicola TaxID=2563114 RepID=A0A4Z0Q2K8_9BACT|nr:DUF6493 family protein [Hymenobacter metallicola]TGE23363.1 hypothetical protein E5K02_19400 [Hymenobacter metallicola]